MNDRHCIWEEDYNGAINRPKQLIADIAIEIFDSPS